MHNAIGKADAFRSRWPRGVAEPRRRRYRAGNMTVVLSRADQFGDVFVVWLEWFFNKRGFTIGFDRNLDDGVAEEHSAGCAYGRGVDRHICAALIVKELAVVDQKPRPT